MRLPEIGIDINSSPYAALAGGGAPAGDPNDYGTLRVWLDSGDWVEDGGDDVTGINNQAGDAVSGLWTNGGDPIVTGSIGSMLYLNRTTSGQSFTANTPETGWTTGGFTQVWLVKPLTGMGGNPRGIHKNSADANGGGCSVATANNVILGSYIGAASWNASEDDEWVADTWHLIILTVASGTTKLYVNAVDKTKAGVSTWGGSGTWSFEYAFSGTNTNANAHHALGMLYQGVPSIENINNIGQWASDRFGLGQTWAVS